MGYDFETGDSMAATRLENFNARYGPVAGPKLYHALQSRAAYIGANGRRRRAIASLMGRPTLADRRPRRDGADPAPLLAGFDDRAEAEDLAGGRDAC